MITWLPALLRIVGRIINGIMNVNAIKRMSPVMRLPNEKSVLF